MLLGNKRGPQVTYAVRCSAGRKPFDKLEGTDPKVHARAYAKEQRAKEGGWAQIERVTTEIIERRR